MNNLRVARHGLIEDRLARRPVAIDWKFLQPDVEHVLLIVLAADEQINVDQIGLGTARLLDDPALGPAAKGAIVALETEGASTEEARSLVSQVLLDGMWAPAPTGEVGGMTTIAFTPVKLAGVMLEPWQATQLFVMPVWLIFEPLNLAPLATGSVAMLEPAPTWQVSHGVVIGMCFVGGPTITKLAAGIAKPATTLASWHCAQFVVVLGAFAWMFASVGMAE